MNAVSQPQKQHFEQLEELQRSPDYRPGLQSVIKMEETEFKLDHLKFVKPRSWKNIPIPVVESMETIIEEFESLNKKLNQ